MKLLHIIPKYRIVLKGEERVHCLKLEILY